MLSKVKNLANLSSAESKTIWTPPTGTMYSHNLWVPQVHLIDEKWYVYFAADDGDNRNHRMYVVENPAANPFEGEFEFRGKLPHQLINGPLMATFFGTTSNCT